MRKLLFLSVLLSILSCTYPKDPENSFEEAKKGSLLVGAVENPPFVQRQGKEFSGSEIALIRKFADQNNLSIRFIPGSESELVERLEKFKIHVVVGGFTKKTIWKKKAGYTAPYDRDDHVLLIPKGENRLLENLEKFIFENKKK